MRPVIRLSLVDDHALFRQGLARLLDAEPGFQIVGQSATIEEGIEVLRTARPDLVLLDVDLAGHRAGDFLDQFPADYEGRVLLVTAVMEPAEIARLLMSGAGGVFSKTSDPEQLLEAIRRVAEGRYWVDQGYLGAFIAASAGMHDTCAEPALSARERSILSRVSAGMTNKEIADELGISEPGVKAGLQRLFHKFGVSNRAQLVGVSARGPQWEAAEADPACA